MAGTTKPSSSTGSGGRPPKRKSHFVTFKISPNIQDRFDAIVGTIYESKPASSTTSQTVAPSTSSPAENASPSNANTPAPSGTDDLIAMPPPADTVVKKGKVGPKRKSEQADGLLKPRGKPGPKKRKLEDGAVDSPGGSKANAAAHKLGPKANQGAINAGLRALDRSGAPCRKWQKGGFQVKSFTGTIWEIPRWRAPPKLTINGQSEGSTSGSSAKENKDNSQVDSERSNGAHEPDAISSVSIPASSPVPVVSAAA